MRLNQIRFFLAVVESGSIRAAARKLNVSPPAITKGVRQLEEELHVRLLERTQHGVVVAPAGRTFVARARVVSSELRKVEEEFAQFARGQSGSVAFGVGPTSMIVIVPDVMTHFRRQWPDARVRIVQGQNPTMLPLVRDGTLDFALGLRLGAKVDTGLRFRPLFHDELVIAARKGHPLSNARSLAQLADAQWLTFALSSSTVGLDQAFSRAGLATPAWKTECDEFTGIIALLAASDMLTPTTRRLVKSSFARDLLREISVTERLPSLTHGIFTRADAPLTPVASTIVQAVIAVARRVARRE